MEKLREWDHALFLYLNGLGSERFDGLWLIITKQIYWLPLFLLLAYLAFRHLGWRRALLLLGFMALLITLTDQSVNFIKNHVQRLRPCNDFSCLNVMRIVKHSSSYSFFSGHAANSMAAALFLFRVLRPYVRYMGLIFLWPLIFAYSRIYLGLHFPSDILCGYLWGVITSVLIFALYEYVRDRIFPPSDDAAHGQSVPDGQ